MATILKFRTYHEQVMHRREKEPHRYASARIRSAVNRHGMFTKPSVWRCYHARQAELVERSTDYLLEGLPQEVIVKDGIRVIKTYDHYGRCVAVNLA